MNDVATSGVESAHVRELKRLHETRGRVARATEELDAAREVLAGAVAAVAARGGSLWFGAVRGEDARPSVSLETNLAAAGEGTRGQRRCAEASWERTGVTRLAWPENEATARVMQPAGCVWGLPLITATGERNGVLTLDFALGEEPGERGSALLELYAQMAADLPGKMQNADRRPASEAPFALLAKHAPVGIFVSDEQGRSVFLNPTWCELAGLTESEARGEGWQRAVHPDDRERVAAEWAEAVQSGRPSVAEYRFLRPDGTVRWLQGSAVQLRDAHGAVTGYIGTVVDVGERRQGEVATRRLAAIVETSDDAIISKNLEGIITTWNRGAERLFGYTAAEIIGQPVTRLIPSDRHEDERSFLERIRRGERIEHHETTRLRKDGVPREVSLTVSPLFNAAGEIVGASKIARDITARKRQEAEVREQEKLYRAIGESINYGIWVCDATGRNLYASDSFLKLVGLTQAECSELGWSRVLHPDDRDATVAAWKTCVAEGVFWEREHRFLGVDRRWHSVLARGVPIRDAAGVIVRWAGINLDISAFKTAEGKLHRQNERLRLLSEALGGLLGAREPQTTVQELLPRVARLFGTDTFFNFMVNETGDALRLNACGGVSEAAAQAIERLEFGQAICGTTALTHEPIHATHIQTSGYDKAALVRGFGIQAYACHPLMAGSRLLGTLSFATRDRPQFEEDELAFMRTISHYVALAIDRARAEQAVRLRTRTQELLNEVSSTLVAELDLTKIMQTVTDAGREVTGAAWGVFLGSTERSGVKALELVTVSGIARERLQTAEVPRLAGLLAGGGIRRVGAANKAEAAAGALAALLPDEGTVRSWLVAPAIARSGEALGGLVFAHGESAGFPAEVGRVIQTIASQAAIAIDNANLYAALQRELEQHKMAEAALRRSEEQLRLVTDNAMVFLAQCDREHRLKFVNRRYAARFGVEPPELVGRHLGEVVGPAAYALLRPHLDEAMTGRRVEFELELPYPRWGKRWMRIIHEPERGSGGAVLGLVAVITDVTARKQAEREMEEARDRALAASRAKDDFLAALSHELRTPLNPVLLLASEAAADAALSDAVRADFAMIRKHVELEARLIDDLLDLTRITRGKLALNLTVQDLHPILRDALATMQPELEQRQLTLVALTAPDPLPVQGDAVRLQQVLWNVLKNAVKFTPPGGRVTVRTRWDRPRDRVVVEIEDTGIGMTATELAHAFTAFSQGDHATTGGSHRFGGVGLGLAISRSLVDLHQGTIRARSEGRDRGATFVIELPRARTDGEVDGADDAGAGSRPPFKEMRTAAGVRGRILLVEDHDATRAALGHLLRRRQFEVAEAGTVADALAAAAAGEFDLVVSDIGLPDGNGFDLMAELRRRYRLQGVALTGYGMDHDIVRGQSAGFAVHLTKPVTIQALDKALHTVMNARAM